MPELRFIISIYLRVIYLLLKIFYIFNIFRLGEGSLYKKKSIIYLIIRKIIIKFKLYIFKNKYQSKCNRFILRQLNIRFILLRFIYSKYFKIKYYVIRKLPFLLCYYFYNKYYKNIDIIYIFIIGHFIIVFYLFISYFIYRYFY